MNAVELEERLFDFSVNCSLLTRKLPINQFYDAKNVTQRIIRASTSSGFHYGETRAAESTRDFLHKLKVDLKELREAKNELGYIQKMEYLSEDDLLPLLKESNELIRIFMATVKTMQAKIR